jgi:hypothetical protein
LLSLRGTATPSYRGPPSTQFVSFRRLLRATGATFPRARIVSYFILLEGEDPVVLVKELSLGKPFFRGWWCLEPDPPVGCRSPDDSAIKARWELSKVPGWLTILRGLGGGRKSRAGFDRRNNTPCAYRKLHPAVSRQMSHCYFPVAFLTQAPVPFLHVADFKAFVADGI